MAIYRPPKPRWPAALAAGAVGLLAGILAGYLIGGHGKADPEAAATELRSRLGATANLLDVASFEYDQGVEGGRVVSQDGYRGALDALARARRQYRQAAPALRAFAPGQAQRIDSALLQLQEMASAKAEVRRFDARVAELKQMLRG